MTKRMQGGWMAVGLMAVAMVPAVAQKTTVKESSSSSSTVTVNSQGGTSSTVKDDLFAGTEVFAKGASDVTEITMDPGTLGMVAGKEKGRAHNMVLNVVRTYSYDKPGMYRIEDVDAFRNKLNTGDWHCSVHTRSLKTGESTDVCSKHRTDDLAESAIITVEPKELTFIHTIRRKGEGEGAYGGYGSLGEMPLMMMRGMNSLAAIDPGAFIDMQMAKAQIAMNGGAVRLQAWNGIDGKDIKLEMAPIRLEFRKAGPKGDGVPADEPKETEPQPE